MNLAFKTCSAVTPIIPIIQTEFSEFSYETIALYLETSEDTSIWLGLSHSPIDTGMPNGLLMLRNCFFDFAVEHCFDCRTTEPGFAGDIGAM